MKGKFFKESKVYWWGGYYIPVRNHLNYHIERKHITEQEKELYEKEFGSKMILENEFNDWLVKVNKTNTKKAVAEGSPP